MAEYDNNPLNKDKSVVDQFEKDYEAGQSLWGEIHANYTKEKLFTLVGDQWDPQQRKDRLQSTPPRPTLTINKTKPHVLQVVNDVKRTRPGVKVRPIGEEDRELAEVRQGIIRGIERKSNGKACRNHALEDAVAAGFGFYRIITEKTNEMSFDSDIKVLKVEDATTVITSDWKEPDASDITFAIIKEQYTKKQFKEEFDEDPDRFQSTSDSSTSWGTQDKGPVVSEYWKQEKVKMDLVKLINGQNSYMDEAKEQAEELGVEVDTLIAVDEDGKQIRRESHKVKIMWYKMANKKILEREEWAGKYIPLILVKGRMTRIEGELKFHSLTGPAMDAQKAYNYARSAIIERMALSPKVPWIYSIGSIPKGEQYKYESSNTRNWWGVGYKAYDEQGNPLPPPQRAQPVQMDPAFTQELAIASDDIKSTTGQYDASLGNRSNEVSGTAITARKMEGDNATFDFIDEFALSIRHEGRIINDLTPFVYDTERQVTMVGEDEEEKIVWVNRQEQKKNGEKYEYKMDAGEFDIEVEMGPSQTTKRQETLEGMEKLFAADPATAKILADIFIKEQDWRFSNVAGERMKKLLKQEYPGIIENDDEPVNPEVQQLQQQMEEMQGEFQQVQMENEDLKRDKSIEEAKVNVDVFNAETNRMKVELDNQTKIETENIKSETSVVTERIKADSNIEEQEIETAGEILEERIRSDASSPTQ